MSKALFNTNTAMMVISGLLKDQPYYITKKDID